MCRGGEGASEGEAHSFFPLILFFSFTADHLFPKGLFCCVSLQVLTTFLIQGARRPRPLFLVQRHHLWTVLPTSVAGNAELGKDYGRDNPRTASNVGFPELGLPLLESGAKPGCNFFLRKLSLSLPSARHFTFRHGFFPKDLTGISIQTSVSPPTSSPVFSFLKNDSARPAQAKRDFRW